MFTLMLLLGLPFLPHVGAFGSQPIADQYAESKWPSPVVIRRDNVSIDPSRSVFHLDLDLKVTADENGNLMVWCRFYRLQTKGNADFTKPVPQLSLSVVAVDDLSEEKTSFWIDAHTSLQPIPPIPSQCGVGPKNENPACQKIGGEKNRFAYSFITLNKRSAPDGQPLDVPRFIKFILHEAEQNEVHYDFLGFEVSTAMFKSYYERRMDTILRAIYPYERIYIPMIGPTGVGKTSFCGHVQDLFERTGEGGPIGGSDGDTGSTQVTTEVRMNGLKDRLWFIDTAGLEINLIGVPGHGSDDEQSLCQKIEFEMDDLAMGRVSHNDPRDFRREPFAFIYVMSDQTLDDAQLDGHNCAAKYLLGDLATHSDMSISMFLMFNTYAREDVTPKWVSDKLRYRVDLKTINLVDVNVVTHLRNFEKDFAVLRFLEILLNSYEKNAVNRIATWNRWIAERNANVTYAQAAFFQGRLRALLWWLGYAWAFVIFGLGVLLLVGIIVVNTRKHEKTE